MKIHRFYTPELHNRFGPTPLGEKLWVHDRNLLDQWLKVLRLQVGDELVLFNDQEDRLYRIEKISGRDEVKVVLVTTLEKNIPSRKIYLFWTVLKRENNELVVQKATELGVHKLVPIFSNRSEKMGLNVERLRKIVIEATEQCGRGDVPEVREPIPLSEAIKEYANDLPIYICEQFDSKDNVPSELNKLGLLVGPEGGWSEEEKVLFKNLGLPHINLSRLTLRAETAAIVAVYELMS